MSAFADALAAVPTRRGSRCTLGLLLGTMEKADAADLMKAVDDEAYGGTQISKALDSLGYEIAPETVLRHRKRSESGGCKCPR